VLYEAARRLVPKRVKETVWDHMMRHHDGSQAGEVTVLDALLRPEFPRYLVDIGAHDGVTISNSRRYVLQGWQAVLVEPHPDIFAKLTAAYAEYPNVRCFNVACSLVSGILPLYLGKNDPEAMASTLCTDKNPWCDRIRGDASVDVKVETVTQLLKDADWPQDFSLLLVDAEGMDYEVLKGLDFLFFRPRILVTEEYISNPEKHRNKHWLLLDQGFTFHSMVGANTIWIANEWVDVCLGLS